MTCIVGLIDNDKIWMGADSCASNKEGHRSIRKDSKIFRINYFLIGASGSFSVSQAVKYKLKLDVKPDSAQYADSHEFMVRVFVYRLKRLLRKEKLVTVTSGKESMDARFLVGFRNRLFSVDGDFQVGEYSDGFYAIGSGQHYALASLNTTAICYEDDVNSFKCRGYSRVEIALSVAEKYVGSVKGPFEVINMEFV